jgi:streptogramin lyase
MSSDRRLVIAGIAAGAVAVAIGLLAVAGVFGGDSSSGPAASTATVSPGRPRTTLAKPPKPSPPPRVTKIRVGGRPGIVAAGAGAVWTADTFSRRAATIDPRSDRVRPLQLPGFPSDVAAGEGAAWFAMPEQGTLLRQPPAGKPRTVKLGILPAAVAVGEGSIWALADREVERIDPRSGDPVGKPIRLPSNSGSIAAGEDGVWAVAGNRSVIRIDPRSGAVGRPIPVRNAFNVTTGGGAIWVTTADSTVVRIDPRTQRAGQPVKVPGALDVAVGEGAVWVTSSRASISRLDPDSGGVLGKPIAVGEEPDSVSVGEGAVWVASAGGGTVTKIEP